MANSKVNPKCTILDKNNELHGALDMHKSMTISPVSVFRLNLQLGYQQVSILKSMMTSYVSQRANLPIVWMSWSLQMDL